MRFCKNIPLIARKTKKNEAEHYCDRYEDTPR